MIKLYTIGHCYKANSIRSILLRGYKNIDRLFYNKSFRLIKK